MQLNNEELHLFFEGMKNSREAHAEGTKSFEYGINGRLHSRNGKLSYSSIKGTIEVYNDPLIVKYLGYFSFADQLVLFVKYDSQIIGEYITVNSSSIFGEDIEVNISFGDTEFSFSNELTLNATEQITTTTEVLIPTEDTPLIDNYTEEIIGETIDLSNYYALGNSNVPNYEVCDTQGAETTPEYNKEYSDAIIILTKENDKTLSSRVAWLGNMNWDINRKITTVGIYENNFYKRVYFTDNLNPLRVFNIKDNSLSFRIAEEFDIIQKSVLLQPFVSEITEEGSVKAMSVQYAYILITENGQATSYSPYSELKLILDDSDGPDFAGGEIDSITNKSVTVKCPIISTLYKEIQCIAIEYKADNIPTAIRILGKKDVSEIVTFKHTGNEPEYTDNITLEELTNTKAIWTYCNDITTKRNKLIAAGLRNEPYAIQEKYISDLFLFKGWDVDGNTHNSLINPEPQTFDHFDPTNTQDNLFLKKQLFTRFLFFGNSTLTFKNKNIDGSEESITFTSSSDEYVEYINEVFDWLDSLQSLGLPNFPNLLITRSNNSILFSPIDETIQTDFSDYVFKSSISQAIIDFQNEWTLLEPTVNLNKLIYGAQSCGFNKGAGVRVSFEEFKEPILNASPELHESGAVLDLETPSLKRTLVKDEIYRLSIQFFKNGNPLFAVVLGDIKTPAIGSFKKGIDSSGNIIIDSVVKYANQSELSSTNSSGTTLKLLVHRIEMKVEVRIPCEFKDSIDSFQIQYVERTEENRTILAQGISAPLIRIAKWQNPSKAATSYAPNVSGKWTLPFNGGPLYAIHGLIQVYDDLDYGENWDSMADFGNDWDSNSNVKNRVMRREIPNRKMFYFDSPDMANGRISDKKISNGIVQVLGRLNTDHTQNLIRSRYPYDEATQGTIETLFGFSFGDTGNGIHENYRTNGQENGELEIYKELAFSKKIGYKELGGVSNMKPYTVNVSIFSKFTHFNSEHSIENASELLNKGEIIPSAVLGSSFEAVNMALTLFAQHAFNSSLWLAGIYNDYSGTANRFASETGQSANQSEGYPTVFIRTDDDVFTDELIGEHITNPIYTKAHTHEGNSKNVDIDGNVGSAGNWVGVPVTDSHALVNIKMNNESSVYGGRNKYAFSQNVFIPLGKVIPTKGANATNQSQKFNVQGDFYTSLYLRTKNDFSNPLNSREHTMYQNNTRNDNSLSIRDYNRSGAWAYGVVLETEVESRLSADYRFYRGGTSSDFSLTLDEFINSAYFKKNDLRIYNPVPWNFKDDPLLTNILSASKVKLNGDIFDAWTTFLLNEFYELEKAKGIITNVTNWGDEIYAIQEFETNKINIDTSDFITTQDGAQVAIQKGDGRTFTSHDKISNFGTSIRRALAEGEFGFSFFDEYNKTFVKMAEPLSLKLEIQQKLQELFNNDAIIDTEGYYDSEYKETNIRIRTEKGNAYMLSYNEILGVFNGYIDYDNDIYIMFDKRVFAPITKTKKEVVEVICPVITSELTLTFNANEFSTYQITADNEPTSFNATNLPQGLIINTNTGVISGVVQYDGTYNITISATNECGLDQEVLVLTITSLAPIITSSCFEVYNPKQTVNYQIVAINNPVTYNAENLPPGITMSPSGLITGSTAKNIGTWSVTLTACNVNGCDTLVCDFVIEEDFSVTEDYEILSGVVTECKTCWNIRVLVPTNETRRVEVIPDIQAPATYPVLCLQTLGSTIVSGPLDEIINSNKVYTFGITGNNNNPSLTLLSTITIKIYDNDGITLLRTIPFERAHLNTNC